MKQAAQICYMKLQYTKCQFLCKNANFYASSCSVLEVSISFFLCALCVRLWLRTMYIQLQNRSSHLMLATSGGCIPLAAHQLLILSLQLSFAVLYVPVSMRPEAMKGGSPRSKLCAFGSRNPESLRAPCCSCGLPWLAVLLHVRPYQGSRRAPCCSCDICSRSCYTYSCI